VEPLQLLLLPAATTTVCGASRGKSSSAAFTAVNARRGWAIEPKPATAAVPRADHRGDHGRSRGARRPLQPRRRELGFFARFPSANDLSFPS